MLWTTITIRSSRDTCSTLSSDVGGIYSMAAVHGPRGPFSVSQYKDEQRCGGMALPAERQGEPWPAESLPPDSAAAQRVLAGRRQREDAVGMWHDAFTEERVQQAALQTPPAVERILRRQPRCGTAAQCMRSCH